MRTPRMALLGYMKYTQPLFIQGIMPIKSLYDSKVRGPSRSFGLRVASGMKERERKERSAWREDFQSPKERDGPRTLES
jgi:hypothetical protein